MATVDAFANVLKRPTKLYQPIAQSRMTWHGLNWCCQRPRVEIVLWHSLNAAGWLASPYGSNGSVRWISWVRWSDHSWVDYGIQQMALSTVDIPLPEYKSNPSCFADQDIVARGGKMLMAYKRAGHRVLINKLGDLIIRPNPMEASMRLIPCSGSVQQHLLTSYLQALLSVLLAQFSRKRLNGGMKGVVALASESVPIKVVYPAYCSLSNFSPVMLDQLSYCMTTNLSTAAPLSKGWVQASECTYA